MRHAIIIAGMCMALAGPAPAQQARQESCRATGDIVALAVSARRNGQTADAVKARLTGGRDAVESLYVPTVGPLVDWVFGVDRAALTPRLAEDFKAQCLRYER
ncbi:hypothetical protein [Roseovarius salis]|uniref:hypothetical protein n=1 Tax=Roseovarius salis TaxID=3376063 RepID=UPI0037C66094